jgi:[acyl-carrier-protein] S-malonyltransferase
MKKGKTAFLSPGQGSQYAGMGVKLQRYSVGRETLQEASDVLKMDVAYICCNGTDVDLADTEVTQPAILTCSIAAFRILAEASFRTPKEGIGFPISTIPLSPPLEKGDLSSTELTFDLSATAGLSVGEYSALVVSGVLSFADALKLVKKRARLMAEAASVNPGGMVAILGLNSSVVESICEEASSSGIVSPANYNCPGQVVISGEEEAIQRAVELAQKAGARGCKTLKVSGAFHSALMFPAESGLREALRDITFSKPKIPFVANVTGDYLEEPEEIREMLALQLSHPIQWDASIRRMVDDDINAFVEVGPGKVLSGLVRRIYREAGVSNTEDMLKMSE